MLENDRDIAKTKMLLENVSMDSAIVYDVMAHSVLYIFKLLLMEIIILMSKLAYLHYFLVEIITVDSQNHP